MFSWLYLGKESMGFAHAVQEAAGGMTIVTVAIFWICYDYSK